MFRPSLDNRLHSDAVMQDRDAEDLSSSAYDTDGRRVAGLLGRYRLRGVYPGKEAALMGLNIDVD